MLFLGLYKIEIMLKISENDIFLGRCKAGGPAPREKEGIHHIFPFYSDK